VILIYLILYDISASFKIELPCLLHALDTDSSKSAASDANHEDIALPDFRFEQLQLC